MLLANLLALPVFALTMGAEYALLALGWSALPGSRPTKGYAARDTLVSLGLGLGSALVSSVTVPLVLRAWQWLYAHRLFTLPRGALTWALLFVLEDFCYYVFHRAHHRVKPLWRHVHVRHHSSAHYNLSTALRQSLTAPFTAFPFWLALPSVGFEPWAVLAVKTFALWYQYGLHTEAVGKLGRLEGWVNTPSAHRVHHGFNEPYRDKNFGATLLVWDRLFGTYEPEGKPVEYGPKEG